MLLCIQSTKSIPSLDLKAYCHIKHTCTLLPNIDKLAGVMNTKDTGLEVRNNTGEEKKEI